MKILIVHNYYQLPGGEDDVVANESKLLEANGHTVSLYTVHNDDIKGAGGAIATAANAIYSPGAKRRFAAELAKVRPDIVHVHNFFPLLSPSIYDACAAVGVPVVQTLHNYRLLCASGQLTRNATVCTKCVKGGYHWGVIHKCYRGSIGASATVAAMLSVHRLLGTWGRKVQAFITPSAFMKDQLVETLLPAEKVHVKYNFTPERQTPPDPYAPRSGALFAGRLSAEKGVHTLLETWKTLGEVPLTLLGDGPMMEAVKADANPNISILGWVKQDVLIEQMRARAYLIMPSTWFEGFPVTLALALANGLPIIASNLGAMGEVVEDGKTGLHFTPGDAADLAEKVRWADAHPEEMAQMGRNARAAYEERYEPQKNYERLIEIYRIAQDALPRKAEALQPA